MRIFATSDLHVEYRENADWAAGISKYDYTNDILVVAGDTAHSLKLLDWSLRILTARFKKVLYVPGNHDLWVAHESPDKTSLEKFDELTRLVSANGASMEPHHERDVSIVPLLSWYDYSFGDPDEQLREMWMDYYACRWPDGFGAPEIARHFTALNPRPPVNHESKVITFSHFLPRPDLAPASTRTPSLKPVLGTTLLDAQLRELGSSIHVYGHSHINRHVEVDGVTYINNAFGYPREAKFAKKQLQCIYDC